MSRDWAVLIYAEREWQKPRPLFSLPLTCFLCPKTACPFLSSPHLLSLPKNRVPFSLFPSLAFSAQKPRPLFSLPLTCFLCPKTASPFLPVWCSRLRLGIVLFHAPSLHSLPRRQLRRVLRRLKADLDAALPCAPTAAYGKLRPDHFCSSLPAPTTSADSAAL